MGGRTPICPAFTMRDLIDYVNNVAKTDIKKVKVQDDQVTHTIEMAMCTDSSPKVLLPHIHLYLSLIQGYEFSTVLKEHELFGKSLGGHVRASWNRLVSDIDKDEERDIMDTIRELISEACIGQYDVRERQTFYNRHLVAKSDYREVAIPAFLGNLRSINTLADLLPGDSPIMDENAIKASFLNSMPKAWKDDYEKNVDTNVTDDEVAIQPIVSKMVKLEKASAEKAELNKKRNAANGNGNHTKYKKAVLVTVSPQIVAIMASQRQMVLAVRRKASTRNAKTVVMIPITRDAPSIHQLEDHKHCTRMMNALTIPKMRTKRKHG
jgi:hypothetical protein